MAIPVRRQGEIAGVVRSSVSVALIDRALAEIKQDVVLVSLIVAVLFALIGYYIARKVYRPLKQLAAGARRFAVGKFDTPIYLSASSEMVELADALNRMAVDLNERMQTCTRHLNELEAIVSAMTEGVVTVDVEGNILKLNDVAREQLGIKENNVSGRPLIAVVRSTELAAMISQTRKTGKTVDRDVLFSQLGDHSLRCITTPLCDHEDKTIGVLILLRGTNMPLVD